MLSSSTWKCTAIRSIVATCGSAFFYPAMGAYMPSLVTDERQLGPANSAWSSLQNLSFIIGPAVGGILLAIGGVTVAFVLPKRTVLVPCDAPKLLPDTVTLAPAAPLAGFSALIVGACVTVVTVNVAALLETPFTVVMTL